MRPPSLSFPLHVNSLVSPVGEDAVIPTSSRVEKGVGGGRRRRRGRRSIDPVRCARAAVLYSFLLLPFEQGEERRRSALHEASREGQGRWWPTHSTSSYPRPRSFTATNAQLGTGDPASVVSLPWGTNQDRSELSTHLLCCHGRALTQRLPPFSWQKPMMAYSQM